MTKKKPEFHIKRLIHTEYLEQMVDVFAELAKEFSRFNPRFVSVYGGLVDKSKDPVEKAKEFYNLYIEFNHSEDEWNSILEKVGAAMTMDDIRELDREIEEFREDLDEFICDSQSTAEEYWSATNLYSELKSFSWDLNQARIATIKEIQDNPKGELR